MLTVNLLISYYNLTNLLIISIYTAIGHKIEVFLNINWYFVIEMFSFKY